ncbi:MAG: transporter, partial [Pseudonocardiales bacterium]|nr:transporter [Pseudonocardiales bacterium]
APRYALVVAGAALVGFAALSAAGLSPAWAALAAALLLGVPRLLRRQERPLTVVRELHLGFCLFVLALGVIVAAAAHHGLADAADRLLPSGSGLQALLGIALVAAVLSNAVNNIPATLILVPLLAGSPIHLLAMLVGVNVGPNATYAGSLATLLWRKRLPPELRPRAREFHALGAVATPVVLVAAVVSLWASWRMLGA